MNVVLNTRRDDAGTSVCIFGLGERLRAQGVNAVVNDWDDYRRYDVAVFMGYDDDAARARSQNPNIRIVLADPKQSRPEWIHAARSADALLVSSVEQRDVFLRLNRNTHIFFMFPRLDARPRTHADGDPLVVGYHGNRVHLEASAFFVLPALVELAERRPVQLLAMYNVAALGRARLHSRGNLDVRHVAWTPDYAELARADIGIVPSELPIRDRQSALEATALRDGELMYEPFDYLTRYKASTNPGRLYPFAQLGIPVVADFVPSSSQFVVDGESGLLASSPHGWLEAFEALAASAELRTTLARGLREKLASAYDAQIPALLRFLEEERKPPPPDLGWPTSAQEQARVGAYPGPRPAPAWRAALASRLRRARR